MFKLIVRIVASVLVCFGVLWFVNSSFNDFSNDIDLKNPLDVFKVETPQLEEPDINTPNVTKAEAKKEEKSKEKETTKKEVKQPTSAKKETKKQSNKAGITESELEKLIASIRVSTESQTQKYDRNDFEKPTKSYKLNGKSYTRNKYAWHVSKHLIKEQPFEYKCPYTGLLITDPKNLDFDHIVSLKTVNDNCPSWWTNKDKNEYANNQLIGVDVLNKSNRSKSAKTPSEWLPEDNIEDFCFTYLAICSKYDIAMSKIDIQVCKLEILNAISTGEEIMFINQFKEGTKEYKEQLKWYTEIKNL